MILPKLLVLLRVYGEPSGIRTLDLLIKSQHAEGQNQHKKQSLLQSLPVNFSLKNAFVFNGNIFSTVNHRRSINRILCLWKTDNSTKK